MTRFPRRYQTQFLLAACALLACASPLEAVVCPSCARVSFGPAARAFAVGDGPVAAAAGDFDQDGVPDLVVVNGTAKTLVLLRGTETGYAVATTLSLSLTPRGVAASDLDSDGDEDVVVALGEPASGAVQVFLGDGAGNFVPATPIAAGINTSAVVAGDFNGDGAPDVAVTNEGSNTVTRLLGDGTGALANATSIPVGAAPRALAAADLDGDGDLDLAVANNVGNTVSVLLGDGFGGFAASSAPSVGTSPRGVAAADFNEDGRPDLVSANQGSGGSVSVLRGTGGGAFAAAVNVLVGGAPTGIVALDLTADGHADVAVSNGSHVVDLLPGDGAGGFAPQVTTPVRTNPQALVALDADLDGQPDLAVPCRNSNSVALLLTGGGGFRVATRVAVGDAPRGVAAADLDGDGDADLAVANEGSGSLSLLRNDGAGSFVLQSTETVAQRPDSVVAAHLNLDGRIDLAVSNTTSGSVSILLATPTAWVFTSTSVSVGASPDSLVVGDFDRDGDLDLAVCNRETPGTVTVLLNDGGGSFTPQPSVAAGSAPTGIAVADLDGDGDLDLAVANEQSSNVSILIGAGNGSFAKTADLPVASGDSNPFSVAAGDLDGDGDADLATADLGGSGLSVFRNQGSGTFDAPVRLDGNDRPLFMTMADLNRDGDLDLAVAATGLKVLRGSGGIGFEPPEDWVAGQGAIALAVQDLNGDGWLDTAVVVYETDDVAILLSTACRPRRLALVQHPSSCGDPGMPLATQPVVEVQDDGGNPVTCDADTVTAGIVPGTGTAGAILGGTTAVPVSAGRATFTDLEIDLAGRRYQLQFSHPSAPAIRSRRFTLGLGVAIAGPDWICSADVGTWSAGTGYDTYRWSLDGPVVRYAPTITLFGLTPGLHVLSVQARQDGCWAVASRTFSAGDLATVSISTPGPTTVCLSCLGGTVSAAETGGGPVLARQWGYRNVTAGAITPIPGQTGSTYVINGADFPGTGTYFLVETTTPTCGGPMVSNELPVMVGAIPPDDDVAFFAITSRGVGASGENVIQWVNPTGTAAAIHIRWRKAPTPTSNCTFVTSPTGGVVDGEQILSGPPWTTDTKAAWPHGGLELDIRYCYSVFVDTGAGFSGGRVARGHPFDATAGPEKWRYTTAATSVSAPAIGFDGIIAVSNDHTVHAMDRGSGGGVWPGPWVQYRLGGVAYARSPIAPVTVGLASSVVFIGSFDGMVTALDARTGALVWPTSLGSPVLAAPSAMFVRFGGLWDYVMVGTWNTSGSAFHVLDLATGSVIDSFDNLGIGPAETDGSGPIGIISAQASVDYANRRVYVASRRGSGASGSTLWCFDLGPAPDELRRRWSRDLGSIDGSPIVRGDRVYVGTNDGVLYSLDAATGVDDRTFPTGDGPVRGFVFPDRAGTALFFSTNTKVRSVSDSPLRLTENWSLTLGPSVVPSIVLFVPRTTYVYVGGSDGKLYQLDFSQDPPAQTSVTLGDGQAAVGAPSLDIGVSPNTILVGSESGVIHAVEVPLP